MYHSLCPCRLTLRSGSASAAVEVYDTITWRRNAVLSLPQPCYGLGAAVVGNAIYLVGGMCVIITPFTRPPCATHLCCESCMTSPCDMCPISVALLLTERFTGLGLSVDTHLLLSNQFISAGSVYATTLRIENGVAGNWFPLPEARGDIAVATVGSRLLIYGGLCAYSLACTRTLIHAIHRY